MTKLNPGFHPGFDVSRFEAAEQRVLRRMARLFHVTRHGEIRLGQTSNYRYALAKPVGIMRAILHTEREVAVVFSSYADFHPRTIDAFDAIISEVPEEFRVEKVARILISGDRAVAEKVKSILQGKPDAPVVIPFHQSEFSLAVEDRDIVQRIREFTFSRDLFSVSSPLKTDLYFFGRAQLINEICAKLASGENFGLFGLRRSGKTSLINGVARALAARKCTSVVIDCQSPSVHQLRWNELLRGIVVALKEKHSLPVKIMKEEAYDERGAASSFLKDMASLKGKTQSEFVTVLFDEVERISPGTGDSEHWRDGRDFLLFWQSIRAGFQAESSPFTFLIVGTNPNCIERATISGSDNPLFGNVQKRYIPMFTSRQVGEMVNELGGIMGITFNDECIAKLTQDFGGHPFLTRQVCSAIANSIAERPVEVDRTIYAVGYNEFLASADSYVESVVGLLKEQYQDEHEMLKILGHGDKRDFADLAAHDPTLLEHLIGYGLIRKGLKAYYFNIGVVEEYFKRAERPAHILTNSDRLAEISRRRNELERALRGKIKNVMTVAFGKSERQAKVLGKLVSRRRDELQAIPFDVLLSVEASPLYFDELKSIVLGHWESFKNALEISKSEFELYMDAVNRLRSDAHAKDISDQEFNKVRVALGEIERVLEP